MSLAMKARQKVKRKGASKDRVFGCDLVEHLQLSGQDVPQVLKSCTEFVEHHGIVDGIYRLSGVSSNIQKLRLEFDTDRSPDLNKDVYLQDIHCVSSLCKAYFRELPNPLLTYQLYDKFAILEETETEVRFELEEHSWPKAGGWEMMTNSRKTPAMWFPRPGLFLEQRDAVAIQLEEGRLVKIKEVLKELPQPHYRTLEFLMRHLVHMASHSSQTNMHVRNLAIVWAPNLLRSKEIEMSGFNGTAAFMEVRIQSIVVEFILTHVEQLFGDAPLTAGSRESIRKSLLLMESPMALADEKYCFSYNVPAMLNQGDGPPQMRPYHTIIELTDSKKKGSLKAKKWRSIFNLGRASNDAKRKSGKMEDKDDKATKMRLRPAKSMDSLSSMPSTSDDDVQLGRKKSQKQLIRCRESFDGPASLDSSFLESDEYPEKVKGEERQGESEGEATAKSEPTTPKASRSSLIGVAPQGRSPKTGRNRAEKCAGVHISGPFSVTVPFHITSNLTLSRLTRGLECPALNHCSLENEAPESSLAKEEEASKEKDGEPTLISTATTNKDDPTEANIESLLDSEENRISMEVQDSFSFLDSQDAWLGDGLDGDYPRKSSHTAFDHRDSEADGFPVPEDDLGSGFMNEMIGGGMQLEMFSTLPPMDYLSIEECMNEHSEEEEEDQYYLATGCLDSEELSKEVDSEEIYVSAFDDLSPLAAELEHLQEFADRVRGALPPEGTVEDQPFSLIGDISPGDPTVSQRLEAGLETQPGVFPAHYQDLANSSLNPELTSLSEEEEGVPLSSRSNFHGLEAVVKDKATPVKEEPNLCLLQGKGADTRAKDDLLLQLEHLLQEGCPDAVLEKTHGSLALGYNKQTTQPSLEDGRQLHQSAPEIEHVHWPSCDPSIGTDDSTPEMVRTFDEHVDCGFPSQEAELLQSREAIYQPPTIEASSSTESPTLPGAELHVSSLLGNGSETASSESPLMPAPLFAPSPAQDASPGAALPCIPLPDGCSDSNDLLLMASSPNSCPGSPPRKLQQAQPVEALAVPKQVLSDGSVRMKLSANTTRIQQAKSFPVVPPKPQFAKIPPFLTPKTPTEEASLMWPNPPAPDQNRGNGMEESSEGSVAKPPRPLSLDTYYSTRGGNTPAEVLPSSSEMSPDPCCHHLDDLQKQRNSMPVSLEKYGRDCDGRGDAVPKPQCSPLDKYSPWFKSSTVNADDLQHRKGSLPESFEKDGGSSSAKSDSGRGESPQMQLPPGPGLLAKHSSEGSGVAPQKQRQTTWRNGSSMSFDEAVALAKERHMSQAPVRRMQTYCYGDAEWPHSPLRTEKPPPHPKPALKPLGQRPLRPLSCLGTAAAPEALVSGKLFFAQASPDVTLEGQLSPTHEALTFPQDLSPRRRLSLPKIGRRLSLSEEAPGAMPQEQR